MKKNNTKKASNLEEKETVKNKPKKPKKTEEINSNNSEPKVQKLPFLSWKLRPFFMIIWIIFLLLFFVYLLLISFV
ncbi:MAG: hypothetical protein LBQ24_03475 [Candidatus Peribacteria bacterium]|jgi:Flp pilus assembly protein TadB|nr:hypothetical protein [Candidatus Peribacteria bacterium]